MKPLLWCFSYWCDIKAVISVWAETDELCVGELFTSIYMQSFDKTGDKMLACVLVSQWIFLLTPYHRSIASIYCSDAWFYPLISSKCHGFVLISPPFNACPFVFSWMCPPPSTLLSSPCLHPTNIQWNNYVKNQLRVWCCWMFAKNNHSQENTCCLLPLMWLLLCFSSVIFMPTWLGYL